MVFGLVTGFAAGSLIGAVLSNWSDVPLVLRDKPWPALMRTGSVMAQHGSTLGVVGLAFAGVDVRVFDWYCIVRVYVCMCVDAHV